MSNELFVEVRKAQIDGVDGYEARVVLNGTYVSYAAIPNTGWYKIDNNARKSAISVAINRFAMTIGQDIRNASEAAL